MLGACMPWSEISKPSRNWGLSSGLLLKNTISVGCQWQRCHLEAEVSIIPRGLFCIEKPHCDIQLHANQQSQSAARMCWVFIPFLGPS